MKRKKFITLCIAAALLASCSADWEPDTQPCELLPIRLTANAGESPALPEGTAAPGHTRAASTDGLQNTEFAEGEDVAVYIVDCDNAVGTYTATPYCYRAAAAVAGRNALTYYSDETTPSMLYFPTDAASNVSVYAFYPYSRFASVADRATTSLDVTVGTDQSTAAAYRASDVMMATPVTDHSRYPITDNAVNLTFRHLMARLVVRLKQGTHSGTTSAISADCLSASTLTIGSVATEATLNMTNGTVTTGSNATTVTVAAAADLAFYYDNADAAISATEYAIVLPAQALSSANVVTITTAAGETISGTLPAITLTAGSSIVLTLTVSDSGMEATRADYGNGGSQMWRPWYESMTTDDVGKILCSDGSLYASTSAATAAGKTPVAMVFYVGNAGETNSKHKHGLAIALTDATDRGQWSVVGTDQSAFTNIESLYAAKADIAGIAHHEIMKSLSIESGHNRAATVAANYTPAAPNGTSGWFLPSAGQWWLFFNSCGLGDKVGWGNSSANSTDINDLNTSLSSKGVAGFSTGAGNLYWTSSEDGDRKGVYLGFNGYATGIVLHTINKRSDLIVRPILAF